MKELSIKEKAKAYDRVSKEVKDFFEGKQKMYSDVEQTLEYLFPDLKESKEEKTERILHSISSKMSLHLRDIFTEEEFQCFDTWSNVWLEKQGEQKSQRMISAEAKEAMYDKPVGKAEPFDKYEGLTDFERTLADICIGWIGEEPGWKQYVKDNSDVLLRIAAEKFNSIQDVPSEQKPAWSGEDEKILNAAILHIKNETYNYYGGYSSECIMQWLKSLKTRVGYEDRWKPNEEQMKVLSIYADQNNSRGSVLTSLFNDLKKLRNK